MAFLLVSLLQVLPRFVLQSIVGAVTRQKDPAAKVTTDLIASPAAVACTLVMSQDEMHDIKDLDRDFIGRHRDKLTFYWAAGEIDGWVPDARVQEVIEVLGSQKRERPEWYRCDEEMVHAFCLGESAPVRSRTLRLLTGRSWQTIRFRWRSSAPSGSTTTGCERDIDAVARTTECKTPSLLDSSIGGLSLPQTLAPVAERKRS